MFAFSAILLSKIVLRFFMQKLFISIGATIGAIALIGGMYSALINIRKAELSYVLPPNLVKGGAIDLCYPTTFYPSKEVWHVQADGYRYYEVIAKARFPTSTTFYTLYILTGENTCKWLNRNDFSSGRLKYMPSTVAIALAKLRYSQIIQNNCNGSLPEGANLVRCTKQLEDAINQAPNWASPQIDYLFPEDAMALNKLGVKTNKVLVVESIQDFEYRKKKARGHR